MSSNQCVIIANGGAGGLTYPSRRKNGLIKAVSIGYGILTQRGTSIDAVEQAVMILEDTTVFNAGTGSSLNLEGVAEMDAAIMTSDKRFGGVAVITDVRYPICVARTIMEKTDHLVLGGKNAVRFARLNGMKPYDPRTKEKIRVWKKKRRNLRSSYFKKLADFEDYYGTVGVVALDHKGTLCVGTSTGGITMRLPGRIGDTPILGAGSYADKNGAVSATGHGEEILRLLLSLRAVSLMKRFSARIAGVKTLAYATEHGCRCGLIGIDKKGRILCVNNTKAMSWCYVKNGVLRTFRY
jgi:beta-aspartyl-peptidase (threonine type)